MAQHKTSADILRRSCAVFFNRNKETAQTNEKKNGRKGGREKNKEETVIYMHFAMFLAQTLRAIRSNL